jgi:hypothetical protein
MMKTTIFALAVALSFGAAAVPAFADSGDNPERVNTAASLPQGFYNTTPFGQHAQILEQHFANQGESSWQEQRGITPPLPPQAQAQPQAHG